MNRNDAEIGRTDRPEDCARGRFEKLLDWLLAAIRWPAPDQEAMARLSNFWQDVLEQSEEKRAKKTRRRDAIVIASLISATACLLLALALTPWHATRAVSEPATVRSEKVLRHTVVAPERGAFARRERESSREDSSLSTEPAPPHRFASTLSTTWITPKSPSRPTTAADRYQLLLALAQRQTPTDRVDRRPSAESRVFRRGRGNAIQPRVDPKRKPKVIKSRGSTPIALRQHLLALVRRGRVDAAIASGVRKPSAVPLLAEVLAAELSPLQLRRLLYRHSSSVVADVAAAALLQRDDIAATRWTLAFLADRPPAHLERIASWCRKPCFKNLLRIAATRTDPHRRVATRLLQKFAERDALAADMLHAARDPTTALVAAGSARAAGKMDLLRRALAQDLRLRLLLRSGSL